MMTRSEKVANLLGGLLGGLLGSWGVIAFQSAIRGKNEGTPNELNEKSRSWRESSTVSPTVEPATVRALEALTMNILGRECTRNEKKYLAPALHFAFGGMMGLFYGALACSPFRSRKAVTSAWGTAYGTTLWLVADEAVTPALGLTRPPLEFDWTTHAFSFVSHLVYGVILESTRRKVVSMMMESARSTGSADGGADTGSSLKAA